MEIKKRKLNVKYEGQSFEVAFPSVKVLKEYHEEFKEMENKKLSEFQLMEKCQKFLESLGLPIEVSNEFEAGDLQMIMSELTGKKKVK